VLSKLTFQWSKPIRKAIMNLLSLLITNLTFRISILNYLWDNERCRSKNIAVFKVSVVAKLAIQFSELSRNKSLMQAYYHILVALSCAAYV
jgi:hypothetical protein